MTDADTMKRLTTNALQLTSTVMHDMAFNVHRCYPYSIWIYVTGFKSLLCNSGFIY